MFIKFTDTQLAFLKLRSVRPSDVIYQDNAGKIGTISPLYIFTYIAMPLTLPLYFLFRLLLIPIMLVTDVISRFISTRFIFTNPIPMSTITFSYFSKKTSLTNILMALTGFTILAFIVGLIADSLLLIRLILPTFDLITMDKLNLNELIYSGVKNIEKAINPFVSDRVITQAALSSQYNPSTISSKNLEISQGEFSATPAIEAVSPIDFYAIALASYCETEGTDELNDELNKAIINNEFQKKIAKTFGNAYCADNKTKINDAIISYAKIIKRVIKPSEAPGGTPVERVNNAMQIAKLNISNQSKKGIGGDSTQGLLANCWQIKYGKELLFKRFSHPARHGIKHAEALLERRKLAFDPLDNEKKEFEFSLVGNRVGDEIQMNTTYKKALQEKCLTQKIKFLEIPVYEQGNWKKKTFKDWNTSNDNTKAYDDLEAHIHEMAGDPMKQLAQKALTTKIGNKNASSIAAILAMATQGTTYCKSAKDRAGFVTVQAWAIKETLKQIEDDNTEEIRNDQIEQLKDILLIDDSEIDDIKESKYDEIKAIHAGNLAKAYLSQINDHIAQRNCPHSPGMMNSLKLLKEWEKKELKKTADGRLCLAFMETNNAIANLNKGTGGYNPQPLEDRKKESEINVCKLSPNEQKLIYQIEKSIADDVKQNQKDGCYNHSDFISIFKNVAKNNQLQCAPYLAYSAGLASLEVQRRKAQG